MTFVTCSIHSRATKMKLPLPYQRCNVLLLVVVPSSSSSTIHQIAVSAAVAGGRRLCFDGLARGGVRLCPGLYLCLVAFPLNSASCNYSDAELHPCQEGEGTLANPRQITKHRGVVPSRGGLPQMPLCPNLEMNPSMNSSASTMVNLAGA